MAEMEPEQNQDTPAAAEDAAKTDAAPPAPDSEEKEQEKVPYELLALEEKEGCNVEVRVRVPWEAYEKHFEEIFGELKKSAVVDGFRKGKVPLPLLKARFKDDVRDDVIQKVLPNIMEQVEADKKIKVAGDPVLVDKKVEDGQPVELAISAEVFKEVVITDEDVKGLSVKLEQEAVTDEDVMNEIEQQRFESSLIEPAGEDAVFTKGMILTGRVTPLDAEGREAGPTQEDAQIDSETAELDEDVRVLLDGKKAGDTVMIPRKNAEGKVDEAAGSLRLNITGLKKRVKPDLDDEFAKDLGYENLEDYKAKTRQRLETQRHHDAERKAINAVVGQVAEKKGVQAPKSAIEEKARQDMVRFFGHMRATREEVEALFENLKTVAEFDLKRHMILKGFQDHFKIEVTDADVDKRIEEMAEAEGRKPLAIRARLEAEKRLEALKDDLLTEVVNRKILEAAGN